MLATRAHHRKANLSPTIVTIARRFCGECTGDLLLFFRIKIKLGEWISAKIPTP